MSFYRQQLENWLGMLYIRAETVFDIGGAQGNVRERVAAFNVKNYKVLDLPEFDLEDEDVGNNLGEADVIFCLEVFEYLIDPFTAMQNIADMLDEGGKAYITFAFAYPHHEELDMDALRYTEPGIKRLAQSADLKINTTWYRVDKSGLLQGFYKADGMHPSKNYNHHNVTGFIVELVK